MRTAVQLLEPLAHVPEADALPELGVANGRAARAVVDDLDRKPVVVERAPDGELACARVLGHTVNDRVLDERLEQHRRDLQCPCSGSHS